MDQGAHVQVGYVVVRKGTLDRRHRQAGRVRQRRGPLTYERRDISEIRPAQGRRGRARAGLDLLRRVEELETELPRLVQAHLYDRRFHVDLAAPDVEFLDDIPDGFVIAGRCDDDQRVGRFVRGD